MSFLKCILAEMCEARKPVLPSEVIFQRPTVRAHVHGDLQTWHFLREPILAAQQCGSKALPVCCLDRSSLFLCSAVTLASVASLETYTTVKLEAHTISGTKHPSLRQPPQTRTDTQLASAPLLPV